ncbi:MAG: sugar dehydrogenase complex small subunit [Planctomycetota bacterium]
MITWNNIKRFFRGIDIAMMRSEVDNTITLDQPQTVWTSGDGIYARVSNQNPSQVMPPPPYAPWTPEMIQQFGQWRDTDTVVLVDPALQMQAQSFVALSELLTGFSDLNQDPVLALRYLSRLHARSDLATGVDELIQTHAALPREQFIHDVLEGPDTNPKRVAQAIILLWYTGAFFNEAGFPSDFGGAKGQYTDGLVWQAIEAHPMGYSAEGGRYWQRQPGPGGRDTGLGNTAQRPGQPATGSNELA